MWWARARLPFGVRPLGDQWGDRGQPAHRDYLEQFLGEVAAGIRGRCLEFQEDSYTTKFGGARVGTVDILHRDPGNPNATIVADLTTANGIPSDAFDCIICTFVLHLVLDVDRMVAELRRILKPGGVLLAAVPDITVCYPEHHELWRFTEEGLRSAWSWCAATATRSPPPAGSAASPAVTSRGPSSPATIRGSRS